MKFHRILILILLILLIGDIALLIVWDERKRVFIILGIIIALIVCIAIWFCISVSPTNNEFKRDVKNLINKYNLALKEVYTEDDFKKFPFAIKQYLINCGYIGKPKMSYMTMEYKDVDFMQDKNKPKLKIDYTQFNFVKEPSRLAYIRSSLFGIPFEGYDYYQNGIGGMKGVLAKSIKLFNQMGPEMDQACLVTYLAECLFIPEALFKNTIIFEEVSNKEVNATIEYKDYNVSGTFYFNDQYEMIKFKTNCRWVTKKDGTMTKVPWSAICSDYRVSNNGIKYPTKFQAVWNFTEGDFVYFDGDIHKITMF